MNASTTSRAALPADRLLRRVLRANALFTGGSSLILIAAARPLAVLFDLPAPPAFAGVGVVLLVYAVALWLAASRPVLDPRLALAAAVLDTLWVAGSVVELVLGWPPKSVAGKWITGIAADLVGVFAIAQYYAWWRARRQR